MSAEFKSEQLLTCEDAAVLTWLPKRSRGPIHPRTVRDWITVGVKGVQLECAWVGSTPCTSEGALRRFFEAIATAKLPKRTVALAEQRRANKRQDAANAQARRILQVSGILKTPK